MIVLARVDLPEPLGPISAWTSPRSTLRSTPRRIALPSTVTCRFWISRSAISDGLSLLCSGGGGRADAGAGAAARGLDAAALRERGKLGKRGLLERALDAAVDAGPEQLRGAVLVSVYLVVAQHPAVAELAHTRHRHDALAERVHDLGHRDRGRVAGQLVASVRTARGRDELGLAQARDQLLQICERQVLRLGDVGE